MGEMEIKWYKSGNDKNVIILTSRAPVNIAVIKYWGKRDEKLILPINSSISATLNMDDLKTVTTVLATDDEELVKEDELYLNGKKQDIEKSERIQNVLRHTRDLYGDENSSFVKNLRLKVDSVNNFPTAAGLASSASGYCCLTYAIATLFKNVYDIDQNEISAKSLNPPKLPSNTELTTYSRIARQGSGSACRSMFGGWVKWEMGQKSDGSDSVAVPIEFNDEFWRKDVCIEILVANDEKKSVGSSIGMKLSVETSKFLKEQRMGSIMEQRMKEMEEFLRKNDFGGFAKLSIKDSDDMHYVCEDTKPSICYLNETSKKIQKIVKSLNKYVMEYEGDEVEACTYTFDAGPNAVVFYRRKYQGLITGLFEYIFPTEQKNAPLIEKDSIISKEKLNEVIDKLNTFEEIMNGYKIEVGQQNQLKYAIHTSIGEGATIESSDSDLLSFDTSKNEIKSTDES